MEQNANDPGNVHVPADLEPVRSRPMTFGRTVLASGLGFAAAAGSLIFLLFLLSWFLFGALLSSIEETEGITISSGSMIDVPLDRVYPEVYAADGIEALFSFDEEMTFLGLIRAIDRAAADERIEAMRLNFNGYGGSSGQTEELVEALLRFKATGKSLYATAGAVGLSEGEYLVASAADSIILRPYAGVEFNGMYVTLQHFRPLMRKLNVEPIVIKAGSYKSAVEPFLLDRPSDEAREAITTVLEDIQDRFLAIVSENRGIARTDLDSIMRTWPLLRSDDAREVGLVDVVATHDETEDLFRTRLGLDEDEDVETIMIGEYAESESDWFGEGESVAVVYAVGPISSARGTPGVDPFSSAPSLTDRGLIENLREAREDDDVRAIVLRVDSPGGELQPSAAMWREISLAAEEKPLVVSMGGVAASGGYYISAPAQEIFADATTVTGSIGVFALAFNIDGLYEETIGINTETIRTAPHADLLSLTRNLSDEEMAFASDMIDRSYREFLQVVSDGRAMSIDDVESIAQGRIWTGRQAQELGLVDSVGGIIAAIDRAAELAELEEFDLRILPRPMSGFERFMSSFESSATVAAKAGVRLDPAFVERQIKSALLQQTGLQVRLVGIQGLY